VPFLVKAEKYPYHLIWIHLIWKMLRPVSTAFAVVVYPKKPPLSKKTAG